MRSVSYRLADLNRVTVPLGFRGENEHTRVIIDCKKAFDEYPDAIPSMAVSPPNGTAYPAVIVRDGDLVYWDVRDSDLAKEGRGTAQLTFTEDGVVRKDDIFNTVIGKSILPAGPAPDPIADWITEANKALEDVEHAIEAAVHAPIIDDSGYWSIWDSETDQYVPTEVKAEGKDGADGVGIVSIEKTGTSGLVDTYTITFTSGNPVTYTVTNGRDADPAELIDDTAGSGVTNKVWSADKSSSLLTEINSKANASDVTNLAEDVSDLKSAIGALDEFDTDGDRRCLNYANVSYGGTPTPVASNKRISTNVINVKKGDSVIVNSGTGFRFAFVPFAGDTSSYTMLTSSNPAYQTGTKTFKIYVDGFFYVMFADAEDFNANVDLDDFNGSVLITSYAKGKADQKAVDDFKDGYSVTHSNILDDSELVDTTRYWDKTSGNAIVLIAPSGTATYYSYLVPVDGESIYTFKNSTRYVFPVGEDGVSALASALGNVTSIDTSQYTGCKFIAISVRSDTYDMSTYCVSKGSTAKKENTYTYPGWFNEKVNPYDAELERISEELDNFEDGYEVVTLNLLEDLTPTSETKYYSKGATSGKLIMSSTGNATYSSWLIPVDGTSNYTMSYQTRFIFAVASDGETVIGDGLDNKTSIDTSEYEGCKYIAISLRTDTLAPNAPISQYYVSKGNTARTGTETIPPGWLGDKLDNIEDQINSLDVKPKRNKVYMLTDTSFSTEKNFSDFATSTKGKCMHIVVNLSSFTSVTVGLRDSTRPVFYAQVSSDSVYLYDYNGGNTAHTQTYTHGLTIADNLSIDVYSAPNQNLYYVQVGTNGTEYTTPAQFSIAPTGLIYPYASMEGSATFVQFSVDCNTQRPIWMFGDSYHGTYNQARWAYYLVTREKDSRVMMDSFAGENSATSYASLQKLIECGVPDYIVWCLGMNDGGDSGTTPNSTWLGYIELMLALCEENNITPILATIPTVPATNNEGKNKWVRESGLQYIDFAKAVGASDQGVWFDGMLSTDNVHPSVTGAVTLYHAALAGCPQFSQT